jgi:ribonucleotide reductase class II
MSLEFKTDNPQPFDSLGLFTYLRTYARRHDEENPNSTVESWKECITRVVNATNTQLNVGFSPEEQQELFDILYNLKASVAGRFLWQLGTRTVDKLGLMSLQNCAFTVIDSPVEPFTWIMNFLMLGAGCGYRISQEDVAKFPTIQKATIVRQDTKDADFIVPDSRQGWIKLLGKVMKAHFYSGEGFTYSCHVLRSKGAVIKGFGGLSSGPEVLCEGLAKISELLNENAGKNMTSVLALDICNLIGKIVVSGNIRRCLPAGSLVHTDEGLVPIENVKVGANVLTTGGYRCVKNAFVQGKQKLVTITTQDGEFKCTPNHKMAVLISPEDYIWKETSQLCAGDRLMSSRIITTGIKTKLPEWSYEYAKSSTTCKPIVVPELDADMAWFIGLFQGDGYTYPNYEQNGFNSYVSLVFGINEYDIAEKAQHQVQRFGDTLTVTLRKRKGENSFMVHCQSKQLAWYLDKNVKQAKTMIRAPEYILKSTPEIRLAYISGITDSDGCVGNRPIQVVSTVYEDFAKDIQNILYSCGIESRFVRCSDCCESRKGWQRQYNVNLITLRSQKEFSEIPTLMKTLRVNSKSQKANGFPGSFISDSKIKYKYGLYSGQQLNIDSYNASVKNDDLWCPVEVISVTESEESETYDIEVEEMHEFFCNGYLTHNSAQICLGDAKDTEYLRAKRWDLGNVPNWRCYSNNSVICNDISDIIDNEDFWQGYNGKGEPYGLVNLKLSRSCGRLGDTQYPDPNVQGYNPCAEQSLERNETCCLAEIYLPNITSFGELTKVATYLYRICKHSLTLPCPDSKHTEWVVHKNMRMGIGITGYLQATEEQRGWLSETYKALRAFDVEYCSLKGFPTSIKLTTCKPSGTLSILGHCTSGVHPGFSRYYIRRIRIASESKLIKVAKEHGYHVEYVRNFDGTQDYTTQIVEFPYALPEHTILAENCTAIQQMEYVKRLQTEWSDNSVSVTVYYRKEELPEIKEWLRKNYNDGVKSISFLLHSDHGFDQAPLEAITKERYEEMVRNTKPITSVEGICHNAEDEKYIGEGECVGGACPMR